MTWIRRGALFVAISGAALATAPKASATPNFPDALRSYWMTPPLPASPPCLLCHTSSAGGLGTATAPFGSYLRSRGLRSYDVTSLHGALDADRAEGHDSNHDGVSDYDELQAGRDPSAAADGSAPRTPAYGCGQVAPGSPGSPWTVGASLSALGALVSGARARRRRRAGRRFT
jgi:hypothetical protein